MVNRGNRLTCRSLQDFRSQDVEEYQLTTVYDYPGGPVQTIYYHRNGLQHRVGGPAVANFVKGVQSQEEWLIDEKIHRLDGPACTTHDVETGVRTFEQYAVDGKWHREDGPANVERDRITGRILRAEFFLNGERWEPSRAERSRMMKPLLMDSGGPRIVPFEATTDARLYQNPPPHYVGDVAVLITTKCVCYEKESGTLDTIYFLKAPRANGEPSLHREYGPAIQNFDLGVLCNEEWYVDGKQHRADGPALISYDPGSRVKTLEAYFVDDQLHREEGPALIRRDSVTGAIIESRSFLNGRELHPHPRPRSAPT